MSLRKTHRRSSSQDLSVIQKVEPLNVVSELQESDIMLLVSQSGSNNENVCVMIDRFQPQTKENINEQDRFLNDSLELGHFQGKFLSGKMQTIKIIQCKRKHSKKGRYSLQKGQHFVQIKSIQNSINLKIEQNDPK